MKVMYEVCCKESLTGGVLHNNCSAECEGERTGKRCSLTSGCGHAWIFTMHSLCMCVCVGEGGVNTLNCFFGDGHFIIYTHIY